MKELMLNEEFRMMSRDMVLMINKFRLEEGNKTELLHKNLLASIDKEIKMLENVGISTKLNFKPSSYSDGTRSYRCYELNKSGIMQMLNKESAVVRYKTQQYIESLENHLREVQTQVKPLAVLSDDTQAKMDDFINRADEIQSLVSIKKKDSNMISNKIKQYLGIKTIKEDEYGYKTIKDYFLVEMGVSKFEDVTISRDNLVKLDECCRLYKRPFEQLSFK